MVIPGIVTNITGFGAFVDVGVKQDGLVHISEIADRYVTDPAAELVLNQQVMVKVVQVEPGRKRIGLSNTPGCRVKIKFKIHRFMKKQLFFIILLGVVELLAGCRPEGKEPETGVSIGLARQRKQDISNLQYRLKFRIPEINRKRSSGKYRSH